MTTTLKTQHGRKELLFHQGRAVENVSEDRACRTKLAAEPVRDVEKLFRQWDRWESHRVSWYGDLREPIFALADAMGYTWSRRPEPSAAASQVLRLAGILDRIGDAAAYCASSPSSCA